MLALEDLVDLGEALRGAGSKVSTPQLLATQRLLLRLAAEGGLPANRVGLASWIAPVLCSSAAEQDAFDARYRQWLRARFDDATPPPPPPPPDTHSPTEPVLRAWSQFPTLLAAAVVVAAAAWLAGNWRAVPQPTAATASPASAPAAYAPASAASAGVGGLAFVDRYDFGAAAAPPTLGERIVGGHLAWVAAPLLLYALWLLRWLLRQPVLQRIASRTPSQLSEVHVPGAVRALLPGLPLRRLAQELRRRRDATSSELQLEPTVRATLLRGGVFTPVRGSRVEPDYLVLIDRAGLSDHQARLAAEIADELVRSDVLIERYEFNRDARVVRSQGPGAPHAVELAELQERLPDHRVLVFGDGSGCLDPATGTPTAWTQVLAAWSMPVLLTLLPAERWGRREWVLQRLGIQVLPLDAQGLRGLMGVLAGLAQAAAGATPPAGAAALSVLAYERLPRRWLERHPPARESVDRIVADLRAELGPRGLAWLGACAAFPEVHWGITLRLGKALVPRTALFEQLLPRIARLVWFREAYLPDWLRERLLEELSAEDEQLARATLRAMLEIAARGGGEVPLVIAEGAPQVGETPWQRLRRWWQARGDAARAQALLRTAESDSPLRDHIFLRFLSGESRRKIDFQAPGSLLAALRRVPALPPILLAGAAVVTSAGLAIGWPPVHLGAASAALTGLQFSADSQRLRFATQVALEARGRSPRTPVRSAGFEAAIGQGAWRQANDGIGGSWQVVAPGGSTVVVDRQRAGTATPLRGSTPPQGLVDTAFSRDGSRFALADERGVRVWSTADGRMLRSIEPGSRPLSMDLDADGKRVALITQDGDQRLWEVDRGATRALVPAGSPGRLIRFSADGLRVAIVSGGSLTFWNSASGTLEFSNQLSERSTQLLLSEDGRLFVAWGSGGPAIVGQTQSVPKYWGLEGSGGEVELAFSPDGRRIAGIDASGVLRLWDAGSGAAIGGPRLGSPTACCKPRLSFSPDGVWLATAVGTELMLWRTDRPTAPPAVPATGGGASAPAPSPANVGWMAVASLFTAMLVPALALFCSGLAGRSANASLMGRMAVVAGVTVLLWASFGHSLALTAGNAFIGGLDRVFLSGMFDGAAGGFKTAPTFSKGGVIPEPLFALFEAAVAAFAACLVAGGLAGRVRFRTLLPFVVLWLAFAYVPINHMFWYWAGPDAYSDKALVDELNARAGLAWRSWVLDYAGGLVVFMNAAVAGLVGLLYRRRAGSGKEAVARTSPALALAAVSLLWACLVGCIAGSALEAGNSASLAAAGTLWAPAAAVLAWAVAETMTRGRPSVLGAAWGALAGLAASASAAGNVGVSGAITIGLAAGFATPWLVILLKKLLGPDGALDYLGVLAGGALIGALATGVFNGQTLGGPGFVGDWVTTSVKSNDIGTQVLIQAKGVLLTVVWSALASLLACVLVDIAWGWRVRAEEGPATDAPQTAERLDYGQRPIWIGVAVFCLAAGIALGSLAWRGAGQAGVTAASAAASSAAAASAPAAVAANAASAPVAAAGDIGWMLSASVLLLTAVPGISLFCIGLMRQRDTAAAAARVLTVFAVTLLFWFSVGYSLVYTEGNAYIGSVDRLLLKGVFDPSNGDLAMAATFSKGVYIPELLFVVYQAVIAAFAAGLLAAAFGERLRSAGLLVFIVAWLAFGHAPLAHMSLFWMGPDAYTGKEVVDAMNAKAGLIWQWGALDVAGGFSLAVAASVAGLVCALLSAPRRGASAAQPPSAPLMLAGVSLLWLASYGLNGGAALEFGSFALLAATTNFIVPAVAAFAWGLSETLGSGRPTLKGMSTGALAGLLAAATAAGSVGVGGALAIGAAAGLLGRAAELGIGRWRAHDDVLALFGTLCAAAATGALLTGIFNNERLGGPGLVTDFVTMSIGSNGPLAQWWIQAKALALTVVWSAVVSFIAYRIVDGALGMTPLSPTPVPPASAPPRRAPSA